MFIPGAARDVNVTYVRISVFSTLISAIGVAVADAKRTIDKSDSPLLISSTKFIVNIILDLIAVSKFHVGKLQ